MEDTLETSPCSIFHYQYDGPKIEYYDTSPFTILCTLEKGAEAYYSGVRVVVIAKKIGYNTGFAKAEIQARRPSESRRDYMLIDIRKFAGEFRPIEMGPPDDKDEDYAPSGDGLPLCTFVFELVDSSHARYGSHAEIIFTDTKTSTTELLQIPDTHRVLCDHTKRTTVHSPSCILFLGAKYAELQHRIPSGWCGTNDVNPARICPPTHGFWILPPPDRRSFFTQPPPEILYHIFSILSYDHSYYHNWRKELITMGSVCRAWNVALCIVYEDFESGRQVLHIGRLATTLEDNPMWGRHIKRFSPVCFAGANTEAQFQQRDTLTILKTASNMRKLLVGQVDGALAGEFVEAFCKMTELRQFTHCSPMRSPGVVGEDSEGQTHLNAAQLTKCFAHWPKLRHAWVRGFGQPHADDEYQFASARCTLDQIRFEHGLVSIAQLRAITASSQDTLHTVVLRSIRGISNKELTSWLADFGPNLINLTLEFNVFARSEADELALDATIHMMSKLSYLSIDGPVATVLTLLRFEPLQPRQQRIRIGDPMLIDPHAFVVALQTVKWKNMHVMGLRISDENSELVEEAKKVAKERGIFLLIRQQ